MGEILYLPGKPESAGDQPPADGAARRGAGRLSSDWHGFFNVSTDVLLDDDIDLEAPHSVADSSTATNAA